MTAPIAVACAIIGCIGITFIACAFAVAGRDSDAEAACAEEGGAPWLTWGSRSYSDEE